MGKINVYQSQLDKEIPMEYVGKVIYIGPDDPLSFVNNGKYNIVLDKNNDLKVVDETGEDYLYTLNNPNEIGGKFYFVEDPKGFLKKEGLKKYNK